MQSKATCQFGVEYLVFTFVCCNLLRLSPRDIQQAKKGVRMRNVDILTILAVCCFLIPAGADEEPLQGFTRASSTAERDWEAKFRAIPSPDNQRAYMQRLTAHPHHLGSA